MTPAYIVIREQRSIDTRYWICIELSDAIKIAEGVSAYWLAEYEPDDDDIDRENYGNLLYHCDVEDSFRVSVEPIDIRAAGEYGEVSP